MCTSPAATDRAAAPSACRRSCGVRRSARSRPPVPDDLRRRLPGAPPECAGELYRSIGIGPEARAGSALQILQNFTFFGAPHLLVITSERRSAPTARSTAACTSTVSACCPEPGAGDNRASRHRRVCADDPPRARPAPVTDRHLRHLPRARRSGAPSKPLSDEPRRAHQRDHIDRFLSSLFARAARTQRFVAA